VINKKNKKSSLYYTEQGYMKEKIHWKNLKNLKDFEKWEYQYDELGNLTYIDYYKGEIHTTHQEVLYDKSTFMLKALLVQDVPSNFITIIKFNTEYYD
jgi:YD repeat-containing protein